MSAEIIAQLEQMVGTPLPPAYLKLQSHYPEELRAARRAIDDSDAEGCVHQVELLDDWRGVLFLNQESRADSILEPEGHVFFWPEQLLVIGETGGGDYYCLDTESPDDEVIQFDHQATEFEVIADSLKEFVTILKETFLEETNPEDDADEFDDNRPQAD